jgi:NADH dehydrogenase [ubiquinone] 1 alpha subcomplex assembly factor 7
VARGGAVNELARQLAQRIRDSGPISLADYMAAATQHYYASRDPFGARGDFVTAPEISQMFGELIGLWCVETWRAMGAPGRFVLAELGPGRGTLMRDALRAAGKAPDFLAAAELHLVETSPVLRAAQQEALTKYRPQWQARAEDLPDGPLLLIANEFFDALPVRQFVRAADGWHERCVGLSAERLVFVLEEKAIPDESDAPVGAIREIGGEALALAIDLGRRVARQGGAALLIDYGPAKGGFGDTVQALRAHRRHDALSDPGEADVTAHVDFAALADAATQTCARIHGPAEQGRFLRALGIDARAAMLMNASPVHAVTIAAALRRLTDPDAMGSLFKVMAIAQPALALEGFA